MKIMYMNTLYPPYIGGGAEIILQSLVQGVQNLGHEVVVLTTGETPGINEDDVNGVRVIRAGISNIYWQYNMPKPPFWKRGIWHLLDIYNPAMGNLVKAVIKREKPDIINCHNLAGFSAAAWTAIEQSGVPIVQVLHDLYSICPNSNMFQDGQACEHQCLHCKAFRFFTPRISSKVNSVIGVSQFILDRHLEYGLFKEATIKTAIHNAMTIPQKTTPTNKKQWENVRFGFIGSLTPAKGIKELLAVFSNLEDSTAKLLIAGKGTDIYEEQLKSQKSANIEFLGYSNPHDFFAEIDVLIVPSLWDDTLPGVVFESLAYGVPVIGSRRGGIPEMIQESINGFLFEPNSPHELTQLLNQLIASPETIIAMKQKTLESSKKYIDMDAWLSQYIKVFQESMT